MVVVSVDGLEVDDWRGKDLRSMWGDWGTVVCGETGRLGAEECLGKVESARLFGCACV